MKHFNESPVPPEAIRDDTAAVQPQRDIIPATTLHQEDLKNEMQPPSVGQQGPTFLMNFLAWGDVGMAVREREEPKPAQDVELVSFVHEAHDFLDRTSLLVDMSHLLRDELDQVVRYVFCLSQEAGLTVVEAEQVANDLLTVGNQNRWDVETVKRVAVEVVNNIANREDEVAHFLGVEAVDELTGDHRVVLEQHNVLHLVDHETTNPPRDRCGPVVPDRGVGDDEVIHSIEFQLNAEHPWVGVLLSATSLRCMAYGTIAGVTLRIVVGLVYSSGCSHRGSITSVANLVLLQLFDRAMVCWEPLSVALGELHFVIASASVTTVCLTIYLSLLTTIMYLLVKELEVEVQTEEA